MKQEALQAGIARWHPCRALNSRTGCGISEDGDLEPPLRSYRLVGSLGKSSPKSQRATAGPSTPFNAKHASNSAQDDSPILMRKSETPHKCRSHPVRVPVGPFPAFDNEPVRIFQVSSLPGRFSRVFLALKVEKSALQVSADMP